MKGRSNWFPLQKKVPSKILALLGLNKSAKAGPNGDPITTPLTLPKIFPSKWKCVCNVAKRNNLVNSFSKTLRSYLFSKINLTAVSIVSLKGIFVKILQKNQKRILRTYLLNIFNEGKQVFCAVRWRYEVCL